MTDSRRHTQIEDADSRRSAASRENTSGMRPGRGSALLSGQAAAALAEALTEAGSATVASAAPRAEAAPSVVERSRVARLLHAAALAAKPGLQPILRRAEARIGTAVNKSDSITHLQSEVAALRVDLNRLADQLAEAHKGQAQLRTILGRLAVVTSSDASQARMLETLVGELKEARKDQAQLRAYTEILLQRFVFQIGDGMLAARNRYGYLVLRTADLANVGYLLEGVLPEQGSLAVVETLLAPGDIFVDLGANVGLFTLVAARRVGATGHVHAIEPAPDLVAALDALAALNQIASFVTIHPVAAGATESKVDLYLARTSGHNSLFAEEAALPSTRVLCRPLDALIGPGTEVSVVKIDVEGAELQALAGMTRMIADNPRIVILAEFSPSIIRRAGGTPEGWLASVRAMGFNVLEIDEAAGSLSPLRAEGADDVTSVNLLLHRPEAWSRLTPLLTDTGRAA